MRGVKSPRTVRQQVVKNWACASEKCVASSSPMASYSCPWYWYTSSSASQ